MKISIHNYIYLLLLPILILKFNIANCQILTSSNLPIVIINTGGVSIADEPKIPAGFKIINNSTGLMNNINDFPNHYDGFCGIETRGNSTQDFQKKTYSIELWNSDYEDTSSSLLGMGKEEDWILHAMVIDKSQVRIPFSFYVFQRMGHYASNWRYVELIINNDYKGLYILCEKIKRDDDRVDIAKLDEDDIYGDSLTGGYILRLDWLGYYSQGFSSNYNSQSGYHPLFYQWYYPKAENIQQEQEDYIADWFSYFESAVFSNDYHNNLGIRYTDYINLNSFVDFLIINEMSKNSDGYKLSSYLHKNRDKNGGKLNMGPIWDFDQTYGVSEVCSNYDPTGWTYLQNQPDCEDLMSMPMWWQSMMQDTIFQNRLKCRWQSHRTTFLHEDSIFNWINLDTALISDAKNRNFTRWPHIGQQIWIEPYPIPQSYSEEITVLKQWISNRLDWLDLNFPGNCDNDITIIKEQAVKKELSKVTDLLGRETKHSNQPLFYIYDDGSVEKRIVIE
tara:strand:+ start:459 stop:1973 length:1515 start_codon:yes stop_codon:yes gene_type:complete